ncbi:DUF4395 family protein [Ferruginibacter sp.]|uniref:DUF4395 family protein n=1 Tax=Ferruginibacter sp. TaxID=1940288 RepID=UPI002659A333|nr:DUF4395 family protein [Ferruginibacter sp.]
MANNTVVCPVDFISVNENKARLTAGLVVIFTALYILTKLWLIPLFLLFDFFAWGFNLPSYSLLNIISDKLVAIFLSEINQPTGHQKDLRLKLVSCFL